jgi:hypothetical protein
MGGALHHHITVPAKFARHARHYIEGYMKGYLGHFDKREAARKREAKKLTHVAAEYKQQGTAARHCAVCSMYEGPNKCSAVRSPISATAVCKLFQKRESRVEKRLRRGV